MRSSDAIKSILEEQERSQRSLALDIGITPQALDARMRSKSMKVETLCGIASKLGYRVELASNDNQEQGITIDG